MARPESAASLRGGEGDRLGLRRKRRFLRLGRRGFGNGTNADELAYQAFLREFPDAPQAPAVRARLAELSLARNTPAAEPGTAPKESK